MKSFARRSAVLSDALLAASLLLVLVWWRGSVALFLAGAMVYLAARFPRLRYGGETPATQE